jgi:hypothetical protein
METRSGAGLQLGHERQTRFSYPLCELIDSHTRKLPNNLLRLLIFAIATEAGGSQSISWLSDPSKSYLHEQI